MRIEKLAELTVIALKKALEPRDQKIAALEAKCAELETKHVLLVKSIAPSSQLFVGGSVVHDDEGTPWVALCDTRTLPGASGDWGLTS